MLDDSDAEPWEQCDDGHDKGVQPAGQAQFLGGEVGRLQMRIPQALESHEPPRELLFPPQPEQPKKQLAYELPANDKST